MSDESSTVGFSAEFQKLELDLLALSEQAQEIFRQYDPCECDSVGANGIKAALESRLEKLQDLRNERLLWIAKFGFPEPGLPGDENLVLLLDLVLEQTLRFNIEYITASQMKKAGQIESLDESPTFESAFNMLISRVNLLKQQQRELDMEEKRKEGSKKGAQAKRSNADLVREKVLSLSKRLLVAGNERRGLAKLIRSSWTGGTQAPGERWIQKILKEEKTNKP